MKAIVNMNPAEQASEEALFQVYDSIQKHKSFRLEAGAGAGKTYSLTRALNYLIKTHGNELLLKNQKIACITYTNIAKNEIIERTDGHPIILSETIHSFCWSLLKDFQPFLRKLIPNINEKWTERIELIGDVGKRYVDYNLGYPKVEEHQILIHHDDVLLFMIKLMAMPKFRSIMSNRFPILFIDEYQDTDLGFANALVEYFISTNEGPLIGLFGDHWQKIYGNGCGRIEHPNLNIIGKRANFRSDRVIVECLNRIRPELTQEVCDPSSKGSVVVYHTNEWNGTRRSKERGGHWEGDLLPDVSHKYLLNTKERLIKCGWDLSPQKTKILMLTHSVLASEQGYHNIASVFNSTDYYIKKEDDYIAFFVDLIEPICISYENHRYGEMFSFLGIRTPAIHKHEDKIRWAADMKTLLSFREKGTIGEVIECLKKTKRPRLSDKLESKEKKITDLLTVPVSERTSDDVSFLDRINKLKEISYREIIELAKFIQEKTPFATNHGVKGAEFENVLVVCGRGWNHYNFNQMLEFASVGVPLEKNDFFERNRNLFYVACSRPKKRLALLFTQKLSSEAIKTLSAWFGKNSIEAL